MPQWPISPLSGNLLERLREDLRPLFLLPQTLIEEHAGITQERSSAFGQDQPLAVNFNQAVFDQRLEIIPSVISLLRPQANLKAGHERENLLAQTTIFFRQQMSAQSWSEIALTPRPSSTCVRLSV